MSIEWSEDQPIYRQLRNKMVGLILDGVLLEGEALPSVRTVAVDYQINPLTASKAYQELVAEDVVEKRRGLGMFVKDGAYARLAAKEREWFLETEWPAILKRLKRLDLKLSDLPADVETQEDPQT